MRCDECIKEATKRGKCSACYLRAWRKKNHTKAIESNKRSMRKFITKKREYLLQILRTGECTDCGNTDMRALTFDHIKDNKVESISRLASSGISFDTLKEEITKCEIVCANCHLIRTGTRGGWWKF